MWKTKLQCAGLWIRRSGFDSWLDQRVVLTGTTLNSHRASQSPPRSINDYWWIAREA